MIASLDHGQHTKMSYAEERTYQQVACKLADFLGTQSRMIDLCLYKIQANRFNEEDEKALQVVTLMLQGIGVSANSVCKLGKNLDMNVRDCYAIARSITETSINVAYILSVGYDAAERARLHALQKLYRDLDRQVTIGYISLKIRELANKPNIDDIPDLKAALELFTKNGKEVMDWAGESIDRRIELSSLAEQKDKMYLSTARFSIYRHSSEILHGTYFGVRFLWTDGFEPIKTRSKFKWNYLSHFLNVFLGSFLPMQAATTVFARRFGIGQVIEFNDHLFSHFSDFAKKELFLLEPPNA